MNVENVCSIKYSADLIYVTLSISNIKRYNSIYRFKRNLYNT